MSLDAAPLAVSIGGRMVTHQASGLSFRKEAVGGVQSITLRLSKPLTEIGGDVALAAPVTIYDTRSAEKVAAGIVSDPGRSATVEGQSWDLTCFGPAQHASDQRRPLVYVDTRLDTFKRGGEFSTKNAKTSQDERASDTPTLLISADEGKTITTSWQGDFISRSMQRAGMKLARARCTVDCGITNANYTVRIRTRQGDDGGTVIDSATASTSNQALDGVVGTDFANGHNQMCIQALRTTSSRTATEDDWFEFWLVVQRALLLDADGAEITSGYTADTVYAHEVAADLVGRMLPLFTEADIDTSGTYAIDQLAYPDGISAAEVLTDLMMLETGFYWTTTPDYGFVWAAWPTSVRYEATLDDGGDFPASLQTVYNEVTVRYQDTHGRTKTRTRTSSDAGVTSATLDAMAAAGIVRSETLDVSDELGSAAAAVRIADLWLAEHADPANAGTLTVARPIRDLFTGGTVDPHEIEPGNLIRVRGVESYADALNASSSDGQTVFRTYAMNYASETHSAQLELDTHPRSTTAALVALAKRRSRKR